MRKYLCIFLFLAPWLVCFCQNAVELGSAASADIIQIEDVSDLHIIDSECFSDTITEDPEIVEETIKENMAVQPLVVDYKETKYWRRYKTLRTAGWICLGSGAAFFAGGYALIFAAVFSSDSSASRAFGIPGGIIFFSSPLLVLASIPLLATAYYNRNKAKKLNLNVGVAQLHSQLASQCAMWSPAVSLSLDF